MALSNEFEMQNINKGGGPRNTEGKFDSRNLIDGSLLNPFCNKNEQQMEVYIETFIEETGLGGPDEALIRNGAVLAQTPEAFLSEDGQKRLGLSAEEVLILREEDPSTSTRWKKWKQKPLLYALVACCSLGAAVQGWDETAINQAQSLPQYCIDLKLASSGDPQTPCTGDQSFCKGDKFTAMINSAPYLCCAVLGCWLTEPVNRLLGRRGAIFFSCFVSTVSCIGQAFTNNKWQMLVARFALGIGIGIKSTTVPIYGSECAPKQIRGGLVMLWQLWTAFGIMCGFLSGVAFHSVRPTLKWRLIMGSPAVLPLIVCAYVYTLPESPRWLIAKGMQGGPDKQIYYRKAFNSLLRLRRSPLQAAREIFLVYHMLRNQKKKMEDRNRYLELFKAPRNRRAVIASTICMFFQQFCGVNVFEYYSTTILSKPGGGLSQPLFCYVNPAEEISAGFGIVNFLFAIPAILLIDTFGRRSLLLATFPFLAIFQLFTGLSFLAKRQTVKRWLVTAGMYLFCIFYSVGEGPVPFVYASESMPFYVRDVGMALVTAINWLFNFVLSIEFIGLRDHIHFIGAFSYYAAWCVLGWSLILLFVPETRNKSLEQLDATFMVPSSTRARHGLNQMRYYILRYLLRQDVVRPRIPIEYRDPTTQQVAFEPEYIDFD